MLTHGDSVEKVGEELEVVGRSGSVIAAVQHKKRQIFGLQFHPEVELSLHGKTMFKNFLYSVSQQRGSILWSFFIAGGVLELFQG